MTSGEEKRTQIRHPLTGDLTGAMRSKASGSLIPCIAVDVSRNGMRIILSLDLNVGSELILGIGSESIPLKVMWCAKEPTRKGYFSCGLKTERDEADLTAVFRQVGWLDQEK